ncbi:MAG: 3-carboxy-cis,cis-muconate cycloisomerase [Schumannella sp.]|nr:3-carboxy-cis,cis-muconate cycloisomerase [Schumannella sp.]
MPSDDGDFGLLSPGWAGRPIAAATSDNAVLAGIVLFEVALATVTAPNGVAQRILAAAREIDPVVIAAEARTDGNPVIPLLAVLRSRLDPDDAAWLHRGATSQDALDTALVLMARDAAGILAGDVAVAVASLCELAETHRATVMTGRTLTQPSTPITLGLKLAGWAYSLARGGAAVRTASAALPVQLGGASGTLASFVVLEGAGAGIALTERLAAELGLAVAPAPWHVHRTPLTRLADALVETTDALGTIGANVAVLARDGQLDDGAGGGSSAMPHKSNPVRAVLLNAAARQAPLLAAQLHLAASTVDERPDGSWHAEWQTLRALLRTAGGAAATGRDLAENLHVHPDAIAANLAAAASDLLSEGRRYGSPQQPQDYLGESDALTTRLIASAREELA